PDHPELIAELLRVRTRFRGGAAAIELPRVASSHGDLAIALAAAVQELDASGVTRVRARLSRPTGSGVVRQGSFAGSDADRFAQLFNIPPEQIFDASRRSRW